MTKEESMEGFLQEAQPFGIQAYKVPKDTKDLMQTHVSFSGSPQKHPHEDGRIILVADPYSNNTFYYEFEIRDVHYMEKLPSLVNVHGETITMFRIWVKKKSIGLRCIPFVVGDTGL
jgi:inorganic pyrophosphatase